MPLRHGREGGGRQTSLVRPLISPHEIGCNIGQERRSLLLAAATTKPPVWGRRRDPAAHYLGKPRDRRCVRSLRRPQQNVDISCARAHVCLRNVRSVSKVGSVTSACTSVPNFSSRQTFIGDARRGTHTGFGQECDLLRSAYKRPRRPGGGGAVVSESKRYFILSRPGPAADRVRLL